ncbi:MAG: guanitoxin biosynthesis heme-dependent pre-guanitoxin N-hydroxylase GntA [Sphingomonadaceae bacterium]
MTFTAFDNNHPVAATFRAMVEDSAFPCVGAKAALSKAQMDILVCRDITSAWDDLRIHPALLDVIDRYAVDARIFRTLIVIFDQSPVLSELAFERALWDRVQSLADKDDWKGYPIDAGVSPDPESPHFSLSFGGKAFFVVGLHPAASRPARRFAFPALVFNLHDQFEQLRAEGRYEKLRASIIDRDIALAGSENPMLARHGELSEARQYSGRPVDESWACPYRRRAA